MEHKFCPYCMAPVEDGKPCGACGLTQGSYTPSPHHLPPGTVLRERYLVGRVLGEGGFGITYIGCDLQLELKVAIKEYFPTDKASRVSQASLDVASYTGAAGVNYDKGLKKFLQEARTIARMDKQPVIVNVRDFFEINHTAYIVMEYVEGTTFKELVEQRGGRIPAGELLYLIEPLFFALKEMHGNGLIHRDISPENLMIEKGEVRLLDFGCARESADGGNTLTIALKHGYAPVEQYQSKGQGPWTDVYALSATIYYCLTGRKPPQAMDRLVEDELIPPRKLGVELTQRQEKALLHGMGVAPKRRFQSMEEFHTALYEGFVPGAVEGQDGGAETAATDSAAQMGGADHDDKTVETGGTQDAHAPSFDPAAWLRQNKLLAGGIAAALALAVLLAAVLPRVLGPSSVDGPDPGQSVAGTPEPEDTDPPSQTSAPLDLTFSPDKSDQENGAVLLALLADNSVDTITVPGSVNVSVDEPATLTKTLRIGPGNHFTTFSLPLTIAEGGRLEIAGSMNFSTLLRAMDGGSISVEEGGLLNVSDIWLERKDDLTAAPGATVNYWGGNTVDPDPWQECHRHTMFEEELFADAVHVSNEEQFAQNCRSGKPLVIDGEVTLSRFYETTSHILVLEGSVLNAPCDENGDCTLDVSGRSVVNHGTIRGRISLFGSYDDVNRLPSLENYGRFEGVLNIFDGPATLINLGEMSLSDSAAGTSVIRDGDLMNLGTLTLDSMVEVKGNWSFNAGTITVGRGGNLSIYGGTGWNNYGEIAVEDGGRLRNYGQISLNADGLTVRDGGALHNYGSLSVTSESGLQAQPGAELENSGVVEDFAALDGTAFQFQGTGRVLPRHHDSDRTRHVSSESALRAALADDRCDLVVWNGYGPDRKIDLNGGPLVVTKGLVLQGDRPEFLSGGLTLSGENAFLITDNVDFCGNALHIDRGTALISGDTRGLDGGITVEAGGLLCLVGGTSMPASGQLDLRSGGRFILASNIELDRCAVTVDQDSALRIYGSLGLIDSSVTNDGLIESLEGDLYQENTSLVNNGELQLIGSSERMALGDTTNHGRITVTGQRIEGTLVNEENGIIILEWEDETLRVSGRLDNRGTIRGARGAYIETVDGGSFTGNPVVYGE